MSEQINDPELLAAFFEESAETLTTVANLFIDLEKRPSDLDLIQTIFRPVHSLKGNSTFFGFLAVKRLAHEMETVLDLVRKSKLVATREVISTLLAGLDELRAMIERVRSGGAEIVDQAACEALLERQRAAAAGSKLNGESDDLRQALATVEAFLIHHQGHVEPSVKSAIEVMVMRTRRELGIAEPAKQSQPPALDSRLEELRTLVSTSFTVDADATVVARLSVLVAVLPTIAADERGRSVATELLDAWRTCIVAAGYNDILRDFLASQIELLASLPGFMVQSVELPASPALTSDTTATELRSDAIRTAAVVGASATSISSGSERNHHQEPRSDSFRKEGKSIRVAEARIDTFLHHVGELLVVGDMFTHLLSRVRQVREAQTLSRDFRRANDTFAQLSAKLQSAIMSIRMVPIRPQLAKVPRIIRDVAVAKGKEIEIQVTGDEVEVDKSLIELLDAPLTHLSRNAADHGIETPAQRLAAGKPRQGTVVITVQETDANIVLSVADDGAGLDLVGIQAKAEALGLVAPGSELKQQDIINFIFASGVTTAEQVTDVSGRGVGMDVVRRMIDEAGGSIAVETERGKGTTFRLTLPKGVTTQIMAGFLVRAGGLILVLPLECVLETFRLRGQDITHMQGHDAGRLIVRHDLSVPVVSLAGALGLADRVPPQAVVAVESKGRRVALEVEAVLGVRKVVLRSLDGLPVQEGLYSGGALLGDGTVALILDPDAISMTRTEVVHGL